MSANLYLFHCVSYGEETEKAEDYERSTDMAKYKKVSTDLKFVDREKAIEKFWEDNHIFEKSMENRK